ncbi:MAG: Tad domain-containing protein [Planctomycetota bacterium]|nr:Tad domain-containing protein [Planctomycetota bacterium]
MAQDQGGAVAVILALMLTAIAGMMALAMDLGKAWNLETELQHAADACALVGATQLNGLAGARVRAIEACTNEVSKLIDNEQKFASDGLGADVTFDTKKTFDADGKSENRDIKFYTSLPIATSPEATMDAEAKYIEANVFPREVSFSFSAVVGAVSSASPRARAVAGFEKFFCDSPQIMMCNPNEPPEGDPAAKFDFYEHCPDYGSGPSCVGRGIAMKAHAGGGKIAPGEMGFLALNVYDPKTDTNKLVTGAKNLMEALAAVQSNGVCTDNLVTTEPGNMTSLDRFINVRYDLYWDDADRDDSSLQPSPVVGKGLVVPPGWDPEKDTCKFNPASSKGDWNKPVDAYIGPGKHTPEPDGAGGNLVDGTTGMGVMNSPIQAMAYPKDACTYKAADVDSGYPVVGGTESCLFSDGGEQIGTGQWDGQTYLDLYHPGMIEDSFLLPLCGPGTCADLPNSLDPFIGPDNKLSRWELYNWEKKFDGTTYPNMAYEAEPVCYKPGKKLNEDYSLPEDPSLVGALDRRIIIMAVVNCISMDGGRTQVPRTEPHDAVAVFITEPMGYTVPDTLFGELVDPNGLNFDNVMQTRIRDRILLLE